VGGHPVPPSKSDFPDSGPEPDFLEVTSPFFNLKVRNLVFLTSYYYYSIHIPITCQNINIMNEEQQKLAAYKRVFKRIIWLHMGLRGSGVLTSLPA
jgi:hypothetical protein